MTSFFPLVRVLERWVGLERIHFAHASSFAFPAGDVAEVREESDGAFHVTTTFLGLAGSESPLPAAMSEELLFGDDAGHLQAFYDVFHHEALQLLYLAWKRFAPGADEAESPFRGELLSLIGVDAFSPFAREPAGPGPDGAFALGLSDFARCDPEFLGEEGLEAILRRMYPALDPRVGAGDPRQVDADDADRTSLGERGSVMGLDATFGGSAPDAQGSLRVTVGPVDAATYEELMPGGPRYDDLSAFLLHWTASRARVDLDVLLERGAAPQLSLGGDYGATMGNEARFGGEPSTRTRVRVPLVADADDPTRRRYIDE